MVNVHLNVSPFMFTCVTCKAENKITGILTNKVPFLASCANAECTVRPIDYLPAIQNQLMLQMRDFIKKYYRNQLTCEDPACTNDTLRLPLRFAGKYPVCTFCKKGVMYKKYTESDLYTQLSYFQHIFDLGKLENSIILKANIEVGYHCLKETVERTIKHSGYAMINLTQLYSGFLVRDRDTLKAELASGGENIYYEEDDYDDL